MLALRVHNTLSEIGEAQRTAQLARLNSTKTGRSILERVGINPPAHGGAEDDELESHVPLRDEAARGIIVFPLPKNVNPEKDWERRKARAAALAKQYKSDENGAFVDVAKHPTRRCVYAMAVIRASTGELINAGTIKAKTPCQAEEAAIGLAMGVPDIRTILSDSKTAVRNYARSTVWREAERIVGLARASRTSERHPTGPTITIKWFPAHMGDLPNVDNRNEDADAAARELIRCRDDSESIPAGVGDEQDPEHLVDYGAILRRHREGRREYPAPHRELSRAESVLLRHLQVKCALTPAMARHICPEMFASPVCSVCEQELATLEHIVRCDSAAIPGGGSCDGADGDVCGRAGESHGGVTGADDSTARQELPAQMERWIRSVDCQSQKWAIQRLEGALARQRRTGTRDPQARGAGTQVSSVGSGSTLEF